MAQGNTPKRTQENSLTWSLHPWSPPGLSHLAQGLGFKLVAESLFGYNFQFRYIKEFRNISLQLLGELCCQHIKSPPTAQGLGIE